MSRYIGPRVKKMRALGVNLPGLSRKSIERRPYPPGQHGPTLRRRKESAFKIRLVEKQKLRLYYGLSERQFGRLVQRATRSTGNTGEVILQLLEARLDNVVFRAGFARTIPAARQLVRHGHVTVNGRRLDIPSAEVRVGDVVSLRERSRELDVVSISLAEPVATAPAWLVVDPVAKTITVASAPDGDATLVHVDTPHRRVLRAVMLHAPEQRELLAMVEAWEIRRFPGTPLRAMVHVQLWHPDLDVSIITPSRATAGCFEARIDGDHLIARTWDVLRRELVKRGVVPPGRHTIRSLERWFVLSTESTRGRLLRAWWAGTGEHAREN